MHLVLPVIRIFERKFAAPMEAASPQRSQGYSIQREMLPKEKNTGLLTLTAL